MAAGAVTDTTAVVPVVTTGRGALIQLVETAEAYAAADAAPATRRAYEADWRDFTSWCASVNAAPLPADGDHVALYLTARAPSLAVSTLARRLAAIRTMHREADVPPPGGPGLRKVWSGIRRAHGRPAEKKRALVTEDLRKVLAKMPASPRGLRDRAILLIGFAGALRRSELAALQLEIRGGPAWPLRLRFVSQGVEIIIERSKGDQQGRGAIVGIPNGKTRNCPVAALKSWLAAGEIQSGAVFRRIDRHGRVGQAALTGQAIADIVKAAVEAAGFDAEVYGGHSLRAGLITSAAGAGVAHEVIMAQSRHVKHDTMIGYIRDGDRFRRNAAGKVGL